MAYFIGPSGNFVKTFTISAADRHICQVAFFVLNMLSTKTLKFYNGVQLLATSASIVPGSTVQTILTTVDLTGVTTLTVKTSTRTLIGKTSTTTRIPLSRDCPSSISGGCPKRFALQSWRGILMFRPMW
jgi:hypothetical protein